MTRNLRALSMAAFLAATGALLGCNSGSENRSAYDAYSTTDSAWEPPREEPKPEPKPAPVAAKPAPSPGRECMSFPTGSRNTSVVELCRMMPAEVVVGQEFCYDIVVTNLTDMTLKEVVVSDACGQNFKMTKSTPDATGAPNMVWKLGDFGPRESRTIKVCGTALAAGAVTSCATVSYNSLLCATANVVQPALKLACSAPAEASLCDGYPVKFTLTNTGSGTARAAKVKVEMPAGLTTLDGKSTADLDAGMLAAGQSRDFTVSTKPAKTGTYAVKGSASAEGGLTASSGGCSTVVKQAVLTVKQSGPSRVFLGRNFAWDITITNTGDAPANGCTLVESLPSNAKFVSAASSNAPAGGSVSWSVGALAPGATKTFQVNLTATGDGTAKGVATLKCGCATDASAPVETAMTGVPAILVEVVDDPDPLSVGEATTYTISVTNQGTAADSNIKVTSMLPAGLEYVSSGGATTGTANAGTVTFAPVASLAPKAKVQWTIRAKCIKGEGDSRMKTAVTSDQFKSPIEEVESTNLYE